MFTKRDDQLFTLIKSMTKAEKRHFKLYANRTQSSSGLKFVQLFDALDRLDSYDEREILKKAKDLSKSQLPNIKRHLYKQLLISLRLIHIPKNIDIQIREQMDFARILYGKGLYFQSLKLLDRIKSIAHEHHQDLLHMEILEFQKLIEERHITRSRKIPNKVESLIDEAAERSNIINNTTKLSNLKIEIHGYYIQFGHVKNEKDLYIVKELFKSRLSEINQNGLTFFERIFLFQSYVWYYFILLDFQLCYEFSLKWVESFKEKPKMLAEDPDLYMRGYHYLLTSLFNVNDREKFDTCLKDFEVFTQQYQKTFNANSRIIAFLYLYTSKLNSHYLNGTFSLGLEYVNHILSELQKYKNRLDHHRVMVFYYKIAYLYFCNGNYDEALTFLNKIINLKIGQLREDLQCYARLLHLIVHFELGNFDLLEYQVESVYRYIKKMESLNALQRETLNFFRRIINKHPKTFRIEFEKFKKKLEKIAEEPYEKRALLYLNILYWVESKIQEKSFQEVTIKSRL